MKTNVATTSLDAYEALKPTLSRREGTVFAALSACMKAPTSYELVQQMRVKGQAFDVNSVRPRLFALKEKGCVETVGKRTCAVTGRTAFTWRAIEGKPPRAPEKKAPAQRVLETPGLF